MKHKILNSNAIKLIAIIAMTIDHITWKIHGSKNFPVELLPLILHLIGRLTCPIMCFFVAEGYYRTSNIKKYILRMFAFAFVSHFVYMYTWNGYAGIGSLMPFASGEILNQTSVMWPLAWGLVSLHVANNKKLKLGVKVLLIALIVLVTFPSDWSCIAMLAILAMGLNRGRFARQMFWLQGLVLIYSVCYFFLMNRVYGMLQMGTLLAIPILWMYNGQRGNNLVINKIAKWLFYIYYPFHLIIIAFLL